MAHELGVWEDDSGVSAVAWAAPTDSVFVETTIGERVVTLLLLPPADAEKVACEMLKLVGEIRNVARLKDAVSGGASKVILPPAGFRV